jgi:hypothetical protein
MEEETSTQLLDLVINAMRNRQTELMTEYFRGCFYPEAPSIGA